VLANVIVLMGDDVAGGKVSGAEEMVIEVGGVT
jgi:hypothetical protein